MPRSSAVAVRTPGGSYRVVIEPGVLARAGRELAALGAERPLAVITNDVVYRHWGRELAKALGSRRHAIVRVPPGEAHKNLAAAERICEQLVAQGADRSSLLVGFGGGIIGDVAGFVASIFLRGVDYVHIPTTLLAQIDSSVGGKTGVNLRAGKNLVGSFYQPRLVLADPHVLRTLPARELRAGLYEAIKCGVIRSGELFDFIEHRLKKIVARDTAVLADLVRQCVAIKAWVVSRDEREAGLRRILNFGHTVGHALEAETRYRAYLHGEAVAWGMRAATLLAEQRGMIPPGEAARIHALIRALGPLPKLPKITRAALARRLLADKKTRRGVVHFILPERIGRVRVVADASIDAAMRAVELLRKEP